MNIAKTIVICGKLTPTYYIHAHGKCSLNFLLHVQLARQKNINSHIMHSGHMFQSRSHGLYGSTLIAPEISFQLLIMFSPFR